MMKLPPHTLAIAAAALLAGCATQLNQPMGSEAAASMPAPQADAEPTVDPSGGLTLASIRALGVDALGVDARPGGVPTYHSPGYAERARALQKMIEDGRRFFADSLGLRADVNLVVLSEADWARTTQIPYTIPFFSPGSAMIFLPATTAGVIVDDYLASKPRLPAPRVQQIRDAGFSFEAGAHAMVDLIGYHELGHLYTRAYGIQTPGHWVNEFLATYFAYAYLRRAQPHLAELWDGMVQPAPDSRPRHTSLADFDNLYFGVGPENYFWYQGTFAARVSEVFAERGLAFLAAVRDAFPVGTTAPVPGDEVLARLERIHPGFVAWAARLHDLAVTPQTTP